MIQQWMQSVVSSQVDGTALTNSTSATSILPAGAKVTLPPNFFTYIGQKWSVKAGGRISTVVTTPGTLTLDLRLGSVIVATSSAMTLSTTAKTNVTWVLSWSMDLRSSGSYYSSR